MRSPITVHSAAGRILILLAVTWMVTWVTPAVAAMIQVPLERSIQSSDLVVRGRTLDQHCEWTADGRWIVTLVRIQVLETLGGSAPGDELVVRVLGGVLDGIGLSVSDMPAFQSDEESVLFLKRSIDGQTFVVTDNFQGKNTLLDDRVVERDVPRIDFLTQVRAIARDLHR
jgi:hypothetical protein